MGYAEAIEQQARLLRYWQSTDGIAHAGQICSQELARTGAAPSPRDLAHALGHELLQGDPYYVGPPICGLFVGAAATFPDTAMLRDSAPGHAGFVWFAEALPLHDPHGEIVGLRAFSWELQETRSPTAPVVPWIRLADLNGISIGLYVDHRHYARPMLVSAINWDFGSSWDKAWKAKNDEGAEMAALLRAMRRHVAQFFAFIKQRLLATSPRPVQNRAARRRLAKALPHDPVVRVVELRRREYHQRDDAHGQPVAWSCQWLVRGHWRQHFYPGSGEHRPLWIMPHVKGNPDKPLRVAPPIAFEVTR